MIKYGNADYEKTERKNIWRDLGTSDKRLDDQRLKVWFLHTKSISTSDNVNVFVIKLVYTL